MVKVCKVEEPNLNCKIKKENEEKEKKEGQGKYADDPLLETEKTCSIRIKFVEPVLLLTLLSDGILAAILINFIEIQYCKAVLGIHDVNHCLNTTAPHFTQVQKYTSMYSMFQTMSLAVAPSIIVIFLGSWSDTFGRRPLLLMSSLGYFMTLSLWIWGSITNPHPNYFILFDLPLSLTGGGTVVQLAAFCYVCDITTPKSRVFRMGVMLACSYTGTLIGTLSAPFLKNISYTFALMTSLCFVTISFLYTLILLKESVNTTQDQRKTVGLNPFKLSQLKSIYETCYKKQPPQTFRILAFVALLLIISTVQINGESSILYLFLQKGLAWTLEEQSRLACICSILSALVASVGTSKMLGLGDMQLISLVILIRLLCPVTYFIVVRRWLVYVVTPLNSIANIYATLLKSFLSKIVLATDVGKVFALCGVMEAFSVFLGSSIYNTVYKETVETCPNAVFIISMTLCVPMVLLRLKIGGLSKNVTPLSINSA